MAHDISRNLETRKYLRPEEVAAVYGIPARTLQLWRQEAKGPSYSKAGKYVLYPITELDFWIEQRRVATK